MVLGFQETLFKHVQRPMVIYTKRDLIVVGQGIDCSVERHVSFQNGSRKSKRIEEEGEQAFLG